MTNQVKCFRQTAAVTNSPEGIHFRKQPGEPFHDTCHLSKVLNAFCNP